MDGLLKPDTDGFYRNKAAKAVLDYLLEEVNHLPGDNKRFSSRYMIGNGNHKLNKYPRIRGYFQHNQSGKWVAFDNLTNECFVEEFDSEDIALGWFQYELNI